MQDSLCVMKDAEPPYFSVPMLFISLPHFFETRGELRNELLARSGKQFFFFLSFSRLNPFLPQKIMHYLTHARAHKPIPKHPVVFSRVRFGFTIFPPPPSLARFNPLWPQTFCGKNFIRHTRLEFNVLQSLSLIFHSH